MSNGMTALVIGASAGLGIAFVHQLAARGYDVALTARSQKAMEDVAANVTAKHGVRATVHPEDLTAPGSVARLTDQLQREGITPDVLVNNAAFGLSGPFVDYDPAKFTAMMQLNMISLAELTLHVGKAMVQRGRGHILLVGSGASYQATPGMAGYGATKAFLLSLGVALNVEFAPLVAVTVVSPGPMDTGFNALTGFEPPPTLQKMTLPVEYVAKVGLDAMFAGKSSVIPGRMNQLGAFSARLMSGRAAAKLFERMSKAT